MMQEMAATNTILRPSWRTTSAAGVMAYYAMAFQGVAPFGSLLAGGVTAGGLARPNAGDLRRYRSACWARRGSRRGCRTAGVGAADLCPAGDFAGVERAV